MAQQAQAIYLAGANCAEAVWQAYAHKVGIDQRNWNLATG